MTQMETAAVVALLRTGGRPPHEHAELIESAGSALAVLRQDQGANFAQLGLLDEEAMKMLLGAATTDITRWRDEGIQLLTVLDREYPDNLRAVHDRPPLMFVAGALRPSDARSVAVIGARRASPRGVTRATAIARHLVDNGYTVVSGLAAGIDAAAHTAALAAGGRTLAVLGTGVDRCYPPENAVLQRRIGQVNALISQFWPSTPPSRTTFPLRNATMSGVSLATVIVEATHRSGARIQARLALNHGRPVFLADALLSQPWARDLAGRPGVHVVTEPPEITGKLERLIGPNPLVA